MTSPIAAITGSKPVLVTGGAGFLGSNLADRLASEGENVLILDSLSRPGVERNVAWLKTRHPERISFLVEDVRNEEAVADAASRASAVFHFAAQVAVTTSLVDPLTDFSINVQGTLQLLEALRRNGGATPLIFASTNKVYGDLADIALSLVDDAYRPADLGLAARGIGEDRPLDFQTPYGCSKGAADQYVLDYARSFGLPAIVMRMSCIYGPHQMGAEDQGWVAHFLLRALAGEPISIFGDGRQVRDLLFADDAAEAYIRAWKHIGDISGRVFNLGGGPANAVSLRQLIGFLEELFGRSIPISFHPWRAGDQRYYVSDPRRAARELGLPTPTPWRIGLSRLAQWMQDEHKRGEIVASPRERRLARA